MKPNQVAQYQKAGRGFLITRNSATLADTDYEHVAKEIVSALNALKMIEARFHAFDSQHPSLCTNEATRRLLAEIQADIRGAM